MNIKVIEDIFDSYVEYRNRSYDLIHSNDERIEEIDVFLNSIDIESDSYKFFSPFSSDDLYDGKVNLLKEEKEALLLSNENNYLLIKEYDDKINDLEKFFSDLKALENHDDSFNVVNDNSNSFSDSNLSDDKFKYNKFVLDIQEAERKRVAADLHDISVQDLVHVVHELELSSLFIDQDSIRAKLELETGISNLRKVIDEIRNTIFNLRPMSFSDLKLSEAILDFVNNINASYPNVKVEFDVDDISENEYFCLMVYRIIQECVINSVRHTNSDSVLLYVKHNENNLSIIIKDFGIGFDIDTVKDKHYGLSILEDRVHILNGSLNIDSKKNVGTTVNITIPFN